MSSQVLLFLAVQVFLAITASAVLAQDKTPEQAKPALREVIAAVPRPSLLGQAEAAEEQTIIFAGDHDYPPYEYLENGRPKGASVDLVRAIGKVLGRPVEQRLMKWSEAQESVIEGKSDVLTVFGKNEERERLYDFSEPTFIVSFSLFVPLDTLGRFDIQRLSGRRLGVTKGGWPRKYLETNQPGASLVVIDNCEDGFRQLLRGNLDAVVVNTWSGYFTLRKMAISSVGATPQPLKRVVAHMAVRKGNRELLTQIDKALALLKSTGEFDRIIDKWSGRQIVLVEREQVWAVYSAGVLALAVLVLLTLLLFAGKSKRTALTREIAERKLTEEKLQESEARLSAYVEHSPTNISLKDRDGRFTMINRAYERLLGMSREEVVGKTSHDLYDRAFADSAVAYDKIVLDEDRAVEWEATVELKDGFHIWAITKFPLHDATGAITAVGASSFDITERKRAEERIEASLAEKEVLLREVHHRVKNNLQVISSLLRLQGRRTKDKRVLEAFEESRNRISAMSMIHEALHQSPDLSKVCFDRYLKKLIGNLCQANDATEGRIGWSVDVAETSLGIDQAVPFGLLINELVSNAFRHAFPGNRRGNIWVNLSTRDGGEISLEIGDDGIGLPEDMDIRNTDTLGFELAVGLVEQQLHGSIAVDRTAGTRFSIRFIPEDSGERI